MLSSSSWQGPVLNRYLGNKTVILDDIRRVVSRHAEPGAWVCDIFSGSLAVALALKRARYRVAANDINLFSAVYGRAFLTNDEVPVVPLDSLVGRRHAEERRRTAARVLAKQSTEPGYAYLQNPDTRERAVDQAGLVSYLQDNPNGRGLPAEFARSDFFDHYCEAGPRSKFVSSRGRAGRRKYFSAENAKHIDAIVNRLRFWRHEGLLSGAAEAVVLTILLGAVERVSNTQGTYHDFPRDQYDPRALKPLALRLPALDGLIGTGLTHRLGTAEDSLDFIRDVPKHDVLYIDPPYNFRQYTAYYFLPNALCRYPLLDDPDEYFSAVQYVRGQNMSDDFVSSFSKAHSFLPSLAKLIERARAKTVVLSYFDGRNHWNEFKSENNGEGYQRLIDFFSTGLFVDGSLDVVPIRRLNYQSYGGYKARNVLEYLFVAQKR